MTIAAPTGEVLSNNVGTNNGPLLGGWDLKLTFVLVRT